MNKKNVYKNIYKLFFVALIKDLIEEKLYILTLQKLCNYGFKLYHIDDFKDLLNNLHNLNLFDSYNISLLLFLRDIYFKKLILFSKVFNYSDKTQIKDKLYEIKNILNNKLKIIQAFKKIERQENALIASINIGIFDITDWKNNTKDDIIERLMLLKKKHFNKKQLVFMNIPMLHLEELELFIDLENYYIDFVNNIDSKIKEYIENCNIFIQIEEDYDFCCNKLINGDITMLNLRYYSDILEKC